MSSTNLADTAGRPLHMKHHGTWDESAQKVTGPEMAQLTREALLDERHKAEEGKDLSEIERTRGCFPPSSLMRRLLLH
jgi:hypothetical protein